MRSVTALALAVLMAAPPVGSGTPARGTVEGIVSLGGRPLAGFTLALVDLDSGSVFKAKTGTSGQYKVDVNPGEYTLTSQGAAGLSVGRGPLRLFVGAGQTAVADVDLVALPVAQEPPPPTPSSAPAVDASTLPASLPQEPPSGEPVPPSTEPGLEGTVAEEPYVKPELIVPAPEGGAGIRMDKIECLVAGEYPLFDANMDPSTIVARARVFFHPGTTEEWFFVEMAQMPEGQFQGKLPRPRLEASPISYYVQATTTGFVESQTQEVKAIVVADKIECGKLLLAPLGAPGPVQVFSASSGAIITPAGFAAGGLLTAGVVAAVIGGAAAIGIGVGVINNPPAEPSPSPSPTPTPTPVPTPTPTPTPSPSPTPRPPGCSTTPCPVP